VANPSKIVNAPFNYRDQGARPDGAVKTIANAGLFLKASSALVGPGEGWRCVNRNVRPTMRSSWQS